MLITACPEAQSKYVRLTQLQKTEFTSAPTVQQVSEATTSRSIPSSNSSMREAVFPSLGKSREGSRDKVTGFPPKLCLPLQNTWWKRKKGWVNEQINTGFDFTVLIYDSKSIILRRVGRICSFEDLNVHYMCFCNLYS